MKADFLNGSSMLTKIAVTVLAAAIISGLAFSLRVYAFMNAGKRFTPEDYLRGEVEQQRLIHEDYVHKETYEEYQRRIEDRLDRIENKLDRVLSDG